MLHDSPVPMAIGWLLGMSTPPFVLLLSGYLANRCWRSDRKVLRTIGSLFMIAGFAGWLVLVTVDVIPAFAD